MGTRLLKAIVAVLVASGLLVVAWPQFFGLEGQVPFAQLVSFRLAGALVAVAGAAVLVLVAVFADGIRRFTLVLAGLGLAFAVALAGIQVLHGSASAEPRPHRLADLRILSWNVHGGAVPLETIAQRALEVGADIVALQEISPEDSATVAGSLGAAGRPMTVLTAAGDEPALGTALLIGQALGPYAIDETSSLTGTLPSVIARPGAPGLPTLVSAHAAPPTSSVMRQWRSDLTRVAALCTAEEDAIVMGDLNSTVDHWSGIPGDADLGGCTDAGAASGASAVGTWPTAAPSWLGAAIDHVAFSGRWTVSGYQVLDDDGSDHRPILVQLSVQRMTKELH